MCLTRGRVIVWGDFGGRVLGIQRSLLTHEGGQKRCRRHPRTKLRVLCRLSLSLVCVDVCLIVCVSVFAFLCVTWV